MTLLRIEQVVPLPGHRLRLTLTDGSVIERDVGKYLDRDLGIMDLDMFDYELVYGTKEGMSKAERLQFGHSRVAPHCRQITDVANPRLLSRTIACSPAASRRVNASHRTELRMTSGPAVAYSSRMSTTRTSASGRSSTRFSSVSSSYRPASAL